MNWTTAHQTTLEAFDRAFPAPREDRACRAWTKRLAEQFAYAFPTAGWGTKSAGNGRPQSTDVICTRSPFVGFDVLISQGEPGQALAHFPGPLALDGQKFIEVEATNHLGESPEPVPEPAPVPVPAPPAACAFPPRDQGLAFFKALNKKYMVRGYTPTPHYVDMEGTSVWYAQYLLYRTQGLDHAQAQARVFADIDAVWAP